MAKTKTNQLLPSVFQTETNEKFLNATLDNLVTEPNLKAISGFIGRKFAPEFKGFASYVQEQTASRGDYQLESSVVVKNLDTGEIDLHRSYQEIIQDIRSSGGIVNDPNKVFSGDFVTYNPQINLDTFANYSEYLWLPNGPALIEVDSEVNIANIVGQSTATVTLSNVSLSLTNGLKIKFTGNVSDSSYQNREYYVDGVGSSIELVPVAELVIGRSKQKNTFDPTSVFTFVTTPSLNTEETSDVLTVESFGLPDNNQVLSGFSNLSAQTYKFVYPYRGGLNFPEDTDSIAFESGVIGISSVGIPFYGVSNDWTLTVSGGAVKHYDPIFTDVNFRDTYGGERGSDGAYFYKDILPVLRNAWGGTDGFSDGYTNTDGHSKIIGFAADGYPIYGPYGYQDVNDSSSSVVRMRSSYRLSVNDEDRPEPKTVTIALLDSNNPSRLLVDSTTGLNPGMRLSAINGVAVNSTVRIVNNSQSSVLNAPVWNGDINQLEISVNYSEVINPSTGNPIVFTDTLTFEFVAGSFIEDYVYEDGHGTLDEHNGRFCVTPEFPLGTYAYFATIDASGNPVYPYIVGRSYYGSTTIDTNQTLTDPIYVLINRASQDRNPWSRRNRWFHKQVAELGNTHSEFPIDLSQFEKAKRPIIEYNKNLQLFVYGRRFVGQVDLIDTVTTNALVTVQNQLPQEIDGITLVNGIRIIFANENDTNIKTKIWEVEIVNGVVNLNEIQTVQFREIVNVTSGVNGVNQTYFLTRDSRWARSQQYIDKKSFPIFDVVDENDVSFRDQDSYPSFNQTTQFFGTQIFNYKISTTAQDDSFLGFPISYRNINNLGDIEFINYFDRDEFEYRIDGVNYKKKVSSGYLVKNNGIERELVSIWTPSDEPNKQYQIISYIYNDDPNFIIDCEEEIDDIHHHFKVYVNYKHLEEDEYETPQRLSGGEKFNVFITSPLVKGDKVDFIIYSTDVSQLGYYEVPKNLEFNPLNQDFTTVTLGEMRNHIGDMVDNNKLVEGVFPGVSNIRDFDITSLGGKIVKQVSPLSYASLFLAKNQYNFIDAINHAKVQYINFKNKILTLAATARSPIVNTLGGQREALDLILQEIILTKNNYAPWFASDMIPFGDDYNRIDYTVIDTFQRNYPITTVFNDSELSNKSVLVYINNTIATKGKDYTFDQDIPVITFTDDLELFENDTIAIFEYNNTDGCYCPETPTKLGLFPKYEPKIVTVDSRRFVQGHDGSLTLAFDDFRDDILIEFESRIYNNIKVTEKKHLTDFYWTKPGKFRINNFNLREFNSVLSQGFYSWLKENNIEDFTTNDIYKEYVTDPTGQVPRTLDANTGVYSGPSIYTEDPNRFFSYNYKNTRDLDGELLPGSWRACFDYYYDTTTPNLTPWEMLGFTNKPTWWEAEYGPAPYTSGNSWLWEDLQEGRIRQGSRSGVDTNFARPNLTNIIPVDEQGNLIAPANLFAGERNQVDASWTFGNWSPVEWAWRRSPEFRYSWQIALALTQPAKYFSFGVNTQDYDYSELINQYVISDTNKQITKSDIKINGRVVNNAIIRGAGVVNWIAEKLFSDGIVDKNVLKSYIDNHDVRLSYRLAGFSDKNYLKMVAEQYSPQSQTQGVLIPDEDYDLTVSESAPLNNPVYSGVIVQRVADGYKVSGYDTVSPYFLVVNPDFKGKSYDVKIVNEQVKFYEDHLQNVNVVYYNTVFRTRQQVANFISAYQKYLNLVGFEFDDYDGNLETIKNWELSLKEFMYWSQQGWPVGSLITLSPVGASLKFSSPSGVVGELDNTIDGYRIQNQNNKIVPKNNYTVNRQGNNFRITITNPLENNISFARLKLVQHEHVVIFNNQTQFKDVIYNPVFGQRQFRIKVVGKKTANWSGSISPEGFIINQDNIAEWEPSTDYKRGTLINFKNFYYVAKDNVIGAEDFKFSEWKLVDSERFKFGLLPNFSTISGQSRYYFDVDKVDLDSEFDQMSLGLIGYRSRSYFVNAGFNDVTQVKLYQGIVKQKGTKNAIDSVSKIFNDTTTHEEWAFRVGEYGALDNNNFIDIQLSESDVKGNPVSLTINDGKITYTGNRVDYSGIVNYSSATVPTNIFAEETVKYNKENRLKTAGFVNYNDIDYTLFSFDPANASQLPVNTLKTGDTVWVASDFYTEWNVYRVVNSKNNVIKVSNLFNSTLLVETKKAHELAEDFVVILKTEDDIEGIYRVITVVNKTQFVVRYTGVNDITNFVSTDYENVILSYMQSVKIDYNSDIVDITPSDEWDAGDSVWVKNPNTNNWKVLTKNDSINDLTPISSNQISENASYGSIFDISDDKSSLVYTDQNNINSSIFHYRFRNGNYEFFEKIDIPSFFKRRWTINNIIFRRQFIFLLCNDSLVKSILIFKKEDNNRIQFYDFITTNDNTVFNVSSDENWIFTNTTSDLAVGNKLKSYEYSPVEISRQSIRIILGQSVYPLRSDVNFDFTTLYYQTFGLSVYSNSEYELFEQNGEKFIRFLSDPPTTGFFIDYISTNIIPSNYNRFAFNNSRITYREEGYEITGTYDTTLISNVDFDTIDSDVILKLTKENGVYYFDNECQIINVNGDIVIETAPNITIYTNIDNSRIKQRADGDGNLNPYTILPLPSLVRQSIIIIKSENVYEIDYDFDFDYLLVRSGDVIFIKDQDYLLYERNSTKYIEFFSVIQESEFQIIQQPKFLEKEESSYNLRENTEPRNIECDISGRILAISYYESKEVDILKRNLQKYIVSSTNTVTTLFDVSSTMNVYVGDILALFGVDYTIPTPRTIQFTTQSATLGNIVRIESNELRLVQILDTDFSDNNFDFGQTIKISDDASFVYASSPNYTEAQSYEIGIVERWGNYGLLSNTYFSESFNFLSSSLLLSIDNFILSFNSTQPIQSVVNDINGANIPGVVATQVGTRIKIVKDETIDNNPLNVYAMYTFTPNTFDFPSYNKLSNIKNPTKNSYDYFGKSINLKDNDLILIGSPDGTAIQNTTFDLLSQIVDIENETTYDGDTTRFRDKSKSGCIWAFNNLYDSLSDVDKISEIGYVRQISPGNLDNSKKEEVKFSQVMAFKDNMLVIGAPESSPEIYNGFNHGQIYFTSDFDIGWKTIRESSSLVDLRSIEKLFVYSKQSNQILYGLDYIDPNKGKILGVAEQDITYKTDYDPATYNTGDDIGSYVWNEKQLGQVWWDLSTVRFVEYEQDSIEYRTANWSKLFENSSVDVYEWVESFYPPNLYEDNEGEGTPKDGDNTAFTITEFVDEETGVVLVKYYFWVKGKTTVPNNVKNRRIPISTIEEYIRNPVNSGIKFLAPLSTNSVALYNVYGDLVDTDRVLHIDYKSSVNDELIFGEFALVSETDETTGKIPSTIVNKLADSLGGLDAAQRLVPDPTLTPQKQLGLNIRPRQTVFLNNRNATKAMVDYCNQVFKNYRIRRRYDIDTLLFGEPLPSEGLVLTDELLFDEQVETYDNLLYINRIITPTGYRVLVKSDETIEGLWAIYQMSSTKEWERVRAQSWSTNEYWESTDWYASGYDATTVSEFTFDDYNDFNRRAIYTISEFTIVNGGNNYSANTSITLSGGGAITQAVVEPVVQNGKITDVTLLTTGSGYISQPRVTLNPSDNGAIILPVISTESGRIFKIANDGTGKWNLIRTTQTGYEVIGIEDGTIQFSDNLWDYDTNELGFDNDAFDDSRFDKNPQREIREIFLSLKNTIFADDLDNEFVGLFFALIKYIFSEQSYIDWAFKSSYIRINHGVGDLTQTKLYSPKSSDLLRQYIDEVKPYHTIVREYIDRHDYIETFDSSSTDFDIVPYFDTTTNLFRSPQYQEEGRFLQTNPQDQSVFDDTIYDAWQENFKYYVSEAIIVDGGSGFDVNSVFTRTVTNNYGGTDATIQFTTDSTGSIILARVIDGGSGFIRLFNGTNDVPTKLLEFDEERGVSIVLRFANDFTRKVKTTIKYDRVSYGKEPREWLPNRDYKQFEIIRYVNSAYAQNLSLEISSDTAQSEVFVALAFDTSPFEYFAFDSDEEDTFIPGRAWIALRNFNSGNTFRPTAFFNIGGEFIERPVLQPYSGYVSIQVWQPNTEYYQDQIVVYRSIPYLVTARFTSGTTFSGNNLDRNLGKFVLETPANDNAANRVLVYYNPVTGRPGRDLSSLMAGIEYPGVVVQGISFEVGGGFDVAAFDLYPFDLVSVDESGNQVFAEEEMDSIVESIEFINSEDDAEIIIDGDGFITPEYSHAPEEMLPGRVYDTMDMKVLTFYTDPLDTTYITWINSDAYTLGGFFGNGGSNIASANLTLVGYTVSGNVWLETNIGNTIQTNTVVINNLPIVGNTIDISNISIPVANSTQWISVTNVSVDTTAVANTTIESPKLWANLTQSEFTDKFNYHIWKDMNDFNQYLATNIATTTTLVSNLRATSMCLTICGNFEVANASVLPEPVIVISNDDVAAEALNRRLDPNSINIIDLTDYNFGNLANAVYEVYGNVQVYQSKDQYIIDETVYNPLDGIYKKPGVIMINGERMEYWSKFNDTNMLVGVRRATRGTSLLEHTAGEKIYDYTRTVPGAGFLQGDSKWSPEENTIIPTQIEDTFLNFDELIMEDGSPIVTDSDVPIATDGIIISGLDDYTFESTEKYIRTRIFNLPIPGPQITTESGEVIILDGTSPDTALAYEPPLSPVDGRGLYNSGISSPNTSSAVFVVNSLYED